MKDQVGCHVLSRGSHNCTDDGLKHKQLETHASCAALRNIISLVEVAVLPLRPAERLVLPKTAPDRPFRQTFNASPDAVSEGPSTSSFPSGLVDPVSQARLALLSGLFPVPPETLGAMLAAEPKLRDSPIATISASLMELRRRLPNSNLETILTYAPQILFQASPRALLSAWRPQSAPSVEQPPAESLLAARGPPHVAESAGSGHGCRRSEDAPRVPAGAPH